MQNESRLFIKTESKEEIERLIEKIREVNDPELNELLNELLAIIQ